FSGATASAWLTKTFEPAGISGIFEEVTVQNEPALPVYCEQFLVRRRTPLRPFCPHMETETPAAKTRVNAIVIRLSRIEVFPFTATLDRSPGRLKAGAVSFPLVLYFPLIAYESAGLKAILLACTISFTG